MHTKMAEIKKADRTSTDKHAEQLEVSYFPDENVYRYNHLEELIRSFLQN